MTARSVIIAESATPSSSFLPRSHAHCSRATLSTSTGGPSAQERLQTSHFVFRQAQTFFRQTQITANATTD